MPLFRKIADTPRGLVLVVGPTGSGKWTTVCSVVETINLERSERIFVVGAHPSYRFESKGSLVTELHVGQDCDSYDRALAIAHQADLDVVALDDVPTLETLRSALTLAATGHLVIANLHAVTPVEAVERLIESAGAEADALRRALAENLVAVTAQRLLPGKEGGRAPAYEWIVNTPATRTALLNGGLAEAQAADPECQTLSAALDALVASGRVTEETADLHRL
jgi:twitching motility protein PilT